MFTVEAVTRSVLRALRRVIPAVVQVVWRLPWVSMTALLAILRGFNALRKLPTQFLLARADTVRCQRCGTVQSLLGRWRCPLCKGISTTHAKAPCGICGARYPGGYIACERHGCSEAISILGGLR